MCSALSLFYKDFFFGVTGDLVQPGNSSGFRILSHFPSQNTHLLVRNSIMRNAETVSEVFSKSMDSVCSRENLITVTWLKVIHLPPDVFCSLWDVPAYYVQHWPLFWQGGHWTALLARLALGRGKPVHNPTLATTAPLRWRPWVSEGLARERGRWTHMNKIRVIFIF